MKLEIRENSYEVLLSRQFSDKTTLVIAEMVRGRHPQMWHDKELMYADAKRIVSCVNACEGMDDPVKEIKNLRASKATTTLGVGDGNGQLFVHGNYDSIKTVQTKLLELEAARIRIAELESLQCLLAECQRIAATHKGLHARIAELEKQLVKHAEQEDSSHEQG